MPLQIVLTIDVLKIAGRHLLVLPQAEGPQRHLERLSQQMAEAHDLAEVLVQEAER